MTVRAVVFDIGGVLEHSVETGFEGRWERRLGLEPGAFWERIRASGLGRDGNLGRISEEEFAEGWAGSSGWTGAGPRSCCATSGSGTWAS